jgi:hypothetical protein
MAILEQARFSVLVLLIMALTSCRSAEPRQPDQGVDVAAVVAYDPYALGKASRDETFLATARKDAIQGRKTQRAAKLVLTLAGDPTYRDEVRRWVDEADSLHERLAAAYAVCGAGDDSVVPLALRELGLAWREAFNAQQAGKQLTAKQLSADLRDRYVYCGFIVNGLCNRDPWVTACDYLGHTDPAVRFGAIASLIEDRGTPDDPLTVDGYDYHLDATANADAIARWRATAEKRRIQPDSLARQRRQLFGIPEPKRVDPRPELERRYREAVSDAEKKAAALELEAHLNRINPIGDRWIPYPGRGEQPAPDLGFRRSAVMAAIYQYKWEYEAQKERARGDRDAGSKAYQKALSVGTARANQDLGGEKYAAIYEEFLKAGEQILQEWRQLLNTFDPRNPAVDDQELRHILTHTLMAELSMAATTMKDWKRYSWALGVPESSIFDDEIKRLFDDEMQKLKSR